MRVDYWGKHRISQYVRPYLLMNGERGDGQGMTTGSYLHYALRGRAALWSARYQRSLENSLGLLAAEGMVYDGRSKFGGSAWYPTKEFLKKLQEEE